MNLYREVLDHIPTAAIVVDNQMRVRYTNRAFRECFHAAKSKGTLKETTGLCFGRSVRRWSSLCILPHAFALLGCDEERRASVP